MVENICAFSPSRTGGDAHCDKEILLTLFFFFFFPLFFLLPPCPTQLSENATKNMIFPGTHRLLRPA